MRSDITADRSAYYERFVEEECEPEAWRISISISRNQLSSRSAVLQAYAPLLEAHFGKKTSVPGKKPLDTPLKIFLIILLLSFWRQYANICLKRRCSQCGCKPNILRYLVTSYNYRGT